MSAQPADTGPIRHVVRIPRTIAGVRAALAPADRAEFQAQLDAAEFTGIRDVVELWWTRAVVAASPQTRAELAKMDAGTWSGIPAAEVFGERWPLAV